MLAFMFLFIPSVVAEHSNYMTAEANVLAPIVRVRVPDAVSFGTVSPGYVSERQKIIVNNTGTTQIEVTPRLDVADPIFANLKLARRTTEDFVPIGSFSMTIPRPRSLGKSEDDYFYAQLDLRSYSNSIPEDIPNHRATIVFWAVAA